MSDLANNKWFKVHDKFILGRQRDDAVQMCVERYINTSNKDVVWKVKLISKGSEASLDIQAVNRAKQTRNVHVVARVKLDLYCRQNVTRRRICENKTPCLICGCLCMATQLTVAELKDEESSSPGSPIPESDTIHGSFTQSFRLPTNYPELILHLTILLFTGTSSELGEQVSCSPLSKGVLELLTSNEMADVVFVVEGEEVRAHTLVLSALSSVFKIMFTKYPERRIEVVDTNLTAFKEMIRCAVADCDPVVCDPEDLLGVLYLAEKYDLQSLKSRCEKVLLLSVVTKDNVLEILVLCDKLSPTSVKAIADGLVGNWLKDLLREEWEHFHENHPGVAMVVLRAALKALV